MRGLSMAKVRTRSGGKGGIATFFRRIVGGVTIVAFQSSQVAFAAGLSENHIVTDGRTKTTVTDVTPNRAAVTTETVIDKSGYNSFK